MKKQLRSFVIPNPMGLHARAAAKLVQTVSPFSSEIALSARGQTVNGKSIMGVLMLAAGKGTSLQVEVIGEDAEEAMQAIETLINNGFGEME